MSQSSPPLCHIRPEIKKRHLQSPWGIKAGVLTAADGQPGTECQATQRPRIVRKLHQISWGQRKKGSSNGEPQPHSQDQALLFKPVVFHLSYVLESPGCPGHISVPKIQTFRDGSQAPSL